MSDAPDPLGADQPQPGEEEQSDDGGYYWLVVWPQGRYLRQPPSVGSETWWAEICDVLVGEELKRLASMIDLRVEVEDRHGPVPPGEELWSAI